MMSHVLGGILRAAARIASTCGRLAAASLMLWLACTVVSPQHRLRGQELVQLDESSSLSGFAWDFGRSNDPHYDGIPDGWRRYEGVGYPKYVRIGIEAKDAAFADQLHRIDGGLIEIWKVFRRSFASTPMPPSIADLLVDRYLRVDLDGGQAMYESPVASAQRMFQYQLSCQMMTEGLRHNSARAQLVFMNDAGTELETHSTIPVRRSQDWTLVRLDLVRPPAGASKMVVRLRVDRSEDGLEDIRGAVGFDNIQIRQYPRLQIATNETLGVYKLGQAIEATAKIMGLSAEASKVRFRLYDFKDQQIAAKVVTVLERPVENGEIKIDADSMVNSDVNWTLPRLDAGYYRLEASIVGHNASTLSTETTLAVVDDAIGGPPHGAFGWTLRNGSEGIAPRDLAKWLTELGVAWVKYPCWLHPQDTDGAEQTAAVLGRLQDKGIQTVGMLDQPPPSQVANYTQPGRRELVAAHLFSDLTNWQPLLEPVMTRLTLKVRTWQLGADHDHSFLGRPRLRDSVREIAAGLQGFGEPIDVAISWPWLERPLSPGESSWQAVCRSSDPPLGAKELESYLSLQQDRSLMNGPRTWLLVDPIARSQYSRDDRVRDLVLRMATVRNHRVQAAFISNPRDPEQGLLQPNGRPDELLLPWRTTSRLIGNLKQQGSLQLRCGAHNYVFVGEKRAVLMLWSPRPTEELMYLGDQVQAVDVWGKVTPLPNQVDGNQVAQRIPIGPIPTFIIGVDPALLAFRMSVALNPTGLDSFLGEKQSLTVHFENPTQESLVGQLAIRSPETWSIDSPVQGWEMLAGRSATHQFDVVLSNTSRIGQYELPIQFMLETVPPKVVTVYKKVAVGPEGLDLDVATRLLDRGDLRVQIELTNHTNVDQSYDCLLFPASDRQHQSCYATIAPGETVRRTIYWPSGAELVGKRMLLRADEQNGPRVFNHSFEVTR